MRTRTSRSLLVIESVTFVLAMTSLPAWSADDSQFIAQSVPASMTSGASYNVSVTMKNVGTTNWTESARYRLGSENPRDNTTWRSSNRVLLAAGETVAPNQQKAFTFVITAPTTPGTYSFRWGMVHDGAAWFGQVSTNVSVAVSNPPSATDNAQFLSQSVPGSMVVGNAYTATVTMKNTGTSTWTEANLFRLGAENPRDNTTWRSNRVMLASGESVPPGAQKTFTFGVTAPASSGNYNFQWSMVHDGRDWFGGKSTNVAIAVSPPAPPSVPTISLKVGPGGMTDLTVGSSNLMPRTTDYKGSISLIGSCDSSDDQNNISSHWDRALRSLAVGQTLSFSDRMTPFQADGTCAGPNYTLTFYRPYNNSIVIDVSAGPLPRAVTTLSMPIDLLRDDANNTFRYSRNDFKIINSQCNGYNSATGFGRFYREIPRTCLVDRFGRPDYVGPTLANPPVSDLRWCNVQLNYCVVAQIKSGNFDHFAAFNHWGTHNLEPSWGAKPAGAMLNGRIQLDIIPRQ